MFRSFLAVPFASLALAPLAACTMPRIPGITPYKIDIQQGNYISQDMVAQLKAGMSKDQVRIALGTPLLIDVFHADRWDYVYWREAPDGKRESRRLAIFFADGKLATIGGNVVSARPEDGPTRAREVPGARTLPQPQPSGAAQPAQGAAAAAAAAGAAAAAAAPAQATTQGTATPATPSTPPPAQESAVTPAQSTTQPVPAGPAAESAPQAAPQGAAASTQPAAPGAAAPVVAPTLTPPQPAPAGPATESVPQAAPPPAQSTTPPAATAPAATAPESAPPQPAQTPPPAQVTQ